MMKYVFLAGAMTIAAPALAQTAPTSATPSAAAPVTDATSPSSDQTTPATMATPDTTMAAPTTQAAPASSDSSAPAQTAAAPTETKVASVVDTEFATYDKNGDGKLSKAEFSAWMDALKAKADPSAKPDPAYDNAAFAQADKDKSKTVSKAELTKFLAPKS